MIVKLHDLTSEQLDNLHQALADPRNSWTNKWHEHKPADNNSFVWIKSSKATGDQSRPVPVYEVILEVEEKYHIRQKWMKVPMEHLIRILQSIELFSNETIS